MRASLLAAAEPAAPAATAATAFCRGSGIGTAPASAALSVRVLEGTFGPKPSASRRQLRHIQPLARRCLCRPVRRGLSRRDRLLGTRLRWSVAAAAAAATAAAK